MKICNKKSVINVINVSLSLFVLSACGSAIVDDINNDINEAGKNRSASITFVNATDEMVSFYSAPAALIGEIYNSDYEQASVLSGEKSEPIKYQWNDSLSKTEVAVRDTSSQTKKASISYTFDDNNEYFSVAWLDDDSFSLSIIEGQTSIQRDVYNIRFFSETELSIILGDDTSAITSVEKGEVSEILTFDNCADIELINNVQSDFCQIANIGESYLVVIDKNNEVIISEQ